MSKYKPKNIVPPAKKLIDQGPLSDVWIYGTDKQESLGTAGQCLTIGWLKRLKRDGAKTVTLAYVPRSDFTAKFATYDVDTLLSLGDL